ncbi:MAG: GEVED domain-containing protein [Erythrobacter sp.]
MHSLRWLVAGLCTIIAVVVPAAVQAQVCEGIPGLTINGGFEEPDITSTPPTPVQTFGSNPFARLYNEQDVPGWSTTASTNNIELWESGFNSVPSYEGNQHAEVNSNAVGALFQDIITEPGSTIIWRFAHRGRSGTDRIRVEMGAPGGVLDNQGDFDTDNTAWVVYSGAYVVPAGQTTTRFQFRAIQTASGSQTVGNFIDGVVIAPFCDYGDAPSSYPVLRSNNGASHRLIGSVFLGNSVDVEFDGQPSNDATGDDNNGTDDEDGIAFGLTGNNELVRRGTNNLEVTASQAGYVNVWVDFNQDGNWSATERVLADTAVSAGSQTLSFVVPNSSSLGASFARVRYSTDNPAGALGPGGDWGNGEVEDVRIVVVQQAILAIEKTSDVFQDTGVGDGTDKRVPGNDVLYSIDVSNIGEDSPDANSVFVVDALPSEVEFFNGDANGSAAGTARVLFDPRDSGLSLNPNGDVRFSSLAIEPQDFGDCNHNPASGYVDTVTYICFRPQGTMASGATNPSFQLQFRARIK